MGITRVKDFTRTRVRLSVTREIVRDRSFFMREEGLVGFGGGGHSKKIGLNGGGSRKK